MSLVIDIGNTRVKVAKFKNKELLKVVFLKQNEVLNELKKLNFKSGMSIFNFKSLMVLIFLNASIQHFFAKSENGISLLFSPSDQDIFFNKF
jgi:pantothenate kinase type III